MRIVELKGGRVVGGGGKSVGLWKEGGRRGEERDWGEGEGGGWWVCGRVEKEVGGGGEKGFGSW